MRRRVPIRCRRRSREPAPHPFASACQPRPTNSRINLASLHHSCFWTEPTSASPGVGLRLKQEFLRPLDLAAKPDDGSIRNRQCRRDPSFLFSMSRACSRTLRWREIVGKATPKGCASSPPTEASPRASRTRIAWRSDRLRRATSGRAQTPSAVAAMLFSRSANYVSC